MSAMLFRILSMLALLLMPFGMVAMPASAASMKQSAVATMDHGHCDDQAPSKDAAPGSMDCKAMCSAVESAAPLTLHRLPLPRGEMKIALVQSFGSVEPGFDLPPPKRG